ncbi:MAG: YggS family pyridoxal phosphate-dependent enzyme [Gemmatimonadota bacterium]|nr:MAG: YggS family pyridoxal phosphate-dependent enzyme [Gemmatimonadota bacterium]
MYFERLKLALPAVRERIDRACRRVGRAGAEAVVIVAVTKGHSLEALRAAAEVGLETIGENRVQEARQKYEAAGDLGLRWHLVGHLQRNKVRQALKIFELIHSVDSLRLGLAIDREAAKLGRRAAVLVQVNASGEGAKYGLPVDEALSVASGLCEMDNLRVVGVMTMAPFVSDEEILRRTFRRTRRLYDECREHLVKFEARHLSMGMTNDFEIAVEEGSTMLRLGTVLFGER